LFEGHVVVENCLKVDFASIALGFLSVDGGRVVVESLFELPKLLSSCNVFHAIVKMVDALDKAKAAGPKP
jgi:hypothetical protein